MKLTITMDMDNAIFENFPELEAARILARLSHDIAGGIPDVTVLIDLNGNTVGRAVVSAEPTDGICPDCGQPQDSNDGLHGRLC